MADERTYKMLLGAIAGGGSGGLPDYSEANDGDVLAIENGEPAWAAPGGGVLVVNANIDMQVQSYVLDKTWQEIYDAEYSVIQLADTSTKQFMWVAVVAAVSDHEYQVQCGQYSGGTLIDALFESATADGYPVLQLGT